MKKLQLFVITGILVGLSTMSLAQSTANANATANANIAKPIALAWNQNLAFGNLTTPTSIATAVIGVAGINPVSANFISESPVCTNTAPIAVGVVLFGGDPNPGPAVFTVTGQFGYGFAVTLPTGIQIPVLNNINPGGVPTLTLSALTCCVGGNAGVPGTTGVLSVGAGTQWFIIGGTLTIPALAPSGTYQNAGGTFPVTVAYN